MSLPNHQNISVSLKLVAMSDEEKCYAMKFLPNLSFSSGEEITYHSRDMAVMPVANEIQAPHEVHVPLRDNVNPDMATLDPRDSSELVAEELAPPTRETNQDSSEDVETSVKALIGIWLKELEALHETQQIKQQEEYERNVEKLRKEFERELSLAESSYRADTSRLRNQLKQCQSELESMTQICLRLTRRGEEVEEENEDLREQLREKNEELEEKERIIRQLKAELSQRKRLRDEREGKIREDMEIKLVSRLYGDRQVIKEVSHREPVTFENSHAPLNRRRSSV